MKKEIYKTECAICHQIDGHSKECKLLDTTNTFFSNPMPQKEIKEKIEDWEKELIALKIKGDWLLENGIPTEVIPFIEKLLAQEKEKWLMIEKRIKLRLEYCQKQNGLPYCKNCGLCKGDLEAIKKELKLGE